jgi:hypothetical protein
MQNGDGLAEEHLFGNGLDAAGRIQTAALRIPPWPPLCNEVHVKAADELTRVVTRAR